MSHLDAERFTLIAIGDELTADERAHLEGCDECALELAEFEHTVAIGRSTMSVGDLQAPPERVWENILTQVRSAASQEEAEAAASTPSADAAPAPVRERQRRRSRGSAIMFALAASLAVVLTVVGVWSFVRPAAVVELASASLDAFPDHPGAEGSALVVERPDGTREVRVTLDADATDDGFREVWLITADASALVSLGLLEGAEGSFVIPEGIDITEYVLVDVSQEPIDGDPNHSGDSIVRGELSFA
jgi:hypothetical protein